MDNVKNLENKGETATVNEGENLIKITNLIKSHLSGIERAKKELSAQKTMLEDSLSNNPEYREKSDVVKEATKAKNVVKQKIINKPELMDLSAKIKDASLTIKDSQKALSDYLQEYARLSDSRQIEDENGEIIEIIYTAKLVRGTKKQDKFKKY